MDKVRILFCKKGRAIYISHLDLMRTMQRAFNRAQYALKYSEGFNPHAQMSILLPLSVCSSSLCEMMDVQLRENYELSEMPARLNAVLPEGIEVIDAYFPQRKSRDIKYLKVSGVFEYDTADAKSMANSLTEFFAKDSIVITKKTKRGMGDSDIAPAIRSISLTAADGKVCLNAVISAQNPTLNPENLVNALKQLAPELVPDFSEFCRLEIFDENMEIFR